MQNRRNAFLAAMALSALGTATAYAAEESRSGISGDVRAADAAIVRESKVAGAAVKEGAQQVGAAARKMGHQVAGASVRAAHQVKETAKQVGAKTRAALK